MLKDAELEILEEEAGRVHTIKKTRQALAKDATKRKQSRSERMEVTNAEDCPIDSCGCRERVLGKGNGG
jgi:hypothetical protein